MESPNDAPWSECGNGCGAMVEHPNLLAPAPWCAGCNAAQYRGDLGDDVETDEQRLLRHLAEFNKTVADVCNGLPDGTPDHILAMADAINPAPARNVMGYQSISNAHDATIYERGRAHGINAERSAIVAWLRERHIGVGAWAAADDIERGEHLEADDE